MGKSSKTRRPYGSGSIRQVGPNKWAIEACCGRRADGRPRRKGLVINGSKADAERGLMRLRVEMGARTNMGDHMTLDDYFWGLFVPTQGALLAKRTVDTYVSVYRTHIGPAFGSWDAADIGRADVQRWVTTFDSPATAEKCFRHLRAILRAMWDEDLLDGPKPLERRVRLPRHQPSRTDVWGPDELAEALARLRDHQLEALVLAMAGGGLRREEALALDLPGDLRPGTVTGADGVPRPALRVEVSKAWTDGEGQRDDTKTCRARPTTIGEPFASRLWELASDGRPKLLMRRDGTAPLMPSSAPETWRRAFGPKGPLHGMRFVELRTLRHCHETIAADAGFTDAENARLHGHSQQVMYGHYLSVGSTQADRMSEAVRLALGGFTRNLGATTGVQGASTGTVTDDGPQVGRGAAPRGAA